MCCAAAPEPQARSFVCFLWRQNQQLACRVPQLASAAAGSGDVPFGLVCTQHSSALFPVCFLSTPPTPPLVCRALGMKAHQTGVLLNRIQPTTSTAKVRGPLAALLCPSGLFCNRLCLWQEQEEHEEHSNIRTAKPRHAALLHSGCRCRLNTNC